MRSAGGILALLAAATLLGCSDPIIGDWNETDEACSADGDFTVDDDLKVDGTLYLPDGTGYCIACRFEGEVTSDGNGDYSADIEFENCDCDGDSSADADCSMNDDEDELDCTLHSAGCGDLESSWEKDE